MYFLALRLGWILSSVLVSACWSTSEKTEFFPDVPSNKKDASVNAKSDESGITFEGYFAPLNWIPHPGGLYEMGDVNYVDETPIHEVQVAPFSILKTEVTTAQYLFCVTDGHCTEPTACGSQNNWEEGEAAKLPVNCVSHEAAAMFCEYAGGRLPSEAEWEYAAGKIKGYVYPWGDREPDCTLAIFVADGDGSDESAFGCGLGTMDLVCGKTLGNSPLGLCDMAGNLFEWVADTYHDSYEGAPIDGTPWLEGGEGHVIRGGAFFGTASDIKVTRRGLSNAPGSDIGFRCARSL
jgi:formylglycine-generating enzyme required for sulfatase activity